MRVNKWYLIPALFVGAGLSWVIFLSADVDPVTVAIIACVLAVFAGGLATMAERKK